MTFHQIKNIAYSAAFLAIGLMPSQVQASTVNWGAEGGPNNFDTASISFTGFNADTLVSVSGSNANYNTVSGLLFPVTFDLDILLDGIWTNIFNDTTTGTNFLFDNVSNISFTFGEVTGLRGTGTNQKPGFDPLQNWALGGRFSPTLFNFDTIDPPVSAVPVPAALPLFGTGLALMGFIGWRRKRKLA